MRGILFACLAIILAGPLVAQDRTLSPHGTLRIDCDACHQGGTWTGVRISKAFDHRATGFSLAGAHRGASCRACHESLDFTGATTTCASCHEDIHRGELGGDCARCHSPRSFLDRSTMARAHQATRFPLNGSHLAADCTACHRPAEQGRLRFVALDTECWTCHQSDYAATRAPDHTASGLPHTCEQCHSTIIWERGRFNHGATRFPLTGAHLATPCLQCHVNSVYAGTPTDCVACHQQNYDATTNPIHSAAGYPTTCAQCHSTRRWDEFDHGKTAFPLTGAHKTVLCLQCHGDGVYVGKSTACVSCHQANYDGTTSPSHTQLGFSTDCKTCHTTTGWSGAKFDHDATFFPIYSGRHQGLWSGCQTCHTNPANYAEFTCFNCHTHDKSTTDGHHSGVGGYSYVSTECVRCHPRGTAGG